MKIKQMWKKMILGIVKHLPFLKKNKLNSKQHNCMWTLWKCRCKTNKMALLGNYFWNDHCVAMWDISYNDKRISL